MVWQFYKPNVAPGTKGLPTPALVSEHRKWAWITAGSVSGWGLGIHDVGPSALLSRRVCGPTTPGPESPTARVVCVVIHEHLGSHSVNRSRLSPSSRRVSVEGSLVGSRTGFLGSQTWRDACPERVLDCPTQSAPLAPLLGELCSSLLISHEAGHSSFIRLTIFIQLTPWDTAGQWSFPTWVGDAHLVFIHYTVANIYYPHLCW